MKKISIITDYAKQRIDFLKWNEYIRAEIEGTSDRALVLICCSVLDEQLRRLLSSYMIDSHDAKKQELFKNNGPLATFSAKTQLCFFCGIISKHERDTIDTMRKIRNKFAHEIAIRDLEDRLVIDLCDNLSIPDKTYVPESIPMSTSAILKFDTNPFKDGKRRTRFIETFRYISTYLESRTLYIEKQQEYYALNAIEFHENMLNELSRLRSKKEALAKKAKKISKADTEKGEETQEEPTSDSTSEWEQIAKCSEEKFIEYLQRLLDTIKKSYE